MEEKSQKKCIAIPHVPKKIIHFCACAGECVFKMKSKIFRRKQ